jgi:hypothetical protein
LKGFGIVSKSSIQRGGQKLNTYFKPAYTAHAKLIISSDPGEHKTMKEALSCPEREYGKKQSRKRLLNLCLEECGKQCKGGSCTNEAKINISKIDIQEEDRERQFNQTQGKRSI